MTNRVPKVDAHLHLTRWWPNIKGTGYRSDLDFSLKGLLREMDDAGVDFGVLIQSNDAPNTRDGLVEARKLVSGSAGRLRLVSTVDPTKGPKSVADMISRWEKTPELKGIKLFPGYHPFYPHDRRLDPVYEYARSRKIPILIHTGDTMDVNGMIKYSRPIEIDEVAVRFRDVSFVLCHFGNPWIDEAAEVIYKNANTYADISGLLAHPSYPLYSKMIDLCRKRIEEAILMVGSADRVLGGSDWPLVDIQVVQRMVRSLHLSEKDRVGILGGNACRLFGLPLSGWKRAGPS